MAAVENSFSFPPPPPEHPCRSMPTRSVVEGWCNPPDGGPASDLLLIVMTTIQIVGNRSNNGYINSNDV